VWTTSNTSCPVHGERITEFIVSLDGWARERSLERAEADYVSATRNRRPLRFVTGAPEAVEAAWRTRWVSRDLPAQKRERITRTQDSPPDLVVVQPIRDWTCAECGRAETIARHTSLRGSGRVGRSAAGRSLDDEALTLAVVASVRHEDTDYDSLLMSGVGRAEARDLIRPAVDRILASWS